MATTVGRLEEQEREAVPAINLDNLESFVADASWKDLLLELVHKNKLDPWNIDIMELVEKYVDAVRAMRVLDLRVPANIILSAAILVRLKSDMLNLTEPEEVEMSEIIQRPIVSVDALSLRLRLPHKNRITLPELVAALDEAMKVKELREAKKFEAPIEVPILLTRIDVEAEMDALYKGIEVTVDGSRMTTFKALVDSMAGKDPILGVFIPLLFLAHRNKVSLLQERFFDEIIIALN